jgi:hypothetical protein
MPETLVTLASADMPTEEAELLSAAAREVAERAVRLCAYW